MRGRWPCFETVICHLSHPCPTTGQKKPLKAVRHSQGYLFPVSFLMPCISAHRHFRV